MVCTAPMAMAMRTVRSHLRLHPVMLPYRHNLAIQARPHACTRLCGGILDCLQEQQQAKG
eukprot:scaffold166435_cov18-Tisochrysis_lutea.AAC.1